MQDVLYYIHTYGLIVLFLVVVGEYCIPGIPTGIVMPAAGIVAGQAHKGLIEVMIISLIAGIVGSIILYLVGYFLGTTLLEKLKIKHPKIESGIEKTQRIMEEHSFIGIFICRLIPIVRTYVSLICGTVKVNFLKFMIFSIPGIFCWNFSGIVVGYLFGGKIVI
ncbi:DedA family protein [Clostridium perfringens]|nr:DedA family protein [Clostridium perfringens]